MNFIQYSRHNIQRFQRPKQTRLLFLNGQPAPISDNFHTLTKVFEFRCAVLDGKRTSRTIDKDECHVPLLRASDRVVEVVAAGPGRSLQQVPYLNRHAKFQGFWL